MNLLCPICGEILEKTDRTYRCGSGHTFDLARPGYLHLLPVQNKRSLNPGDTREQVLSRRPVLDIGCGEGYYSTKVAAALNAPLTGLDISKEAVRCAAGKYKNALWICGSAARLPFPDRSAGLVMSLFALTVAEEFARVLEDGGLYFQVLAEEDHLMGLKSIIYPTLLHKEKNTAPTLPGFTLAEQIPIRFSFTVEGEQVMHLLSMTPHVYRISKEGAARLAATQSLTDTASCVLNIYRKD